MSVSGAPSSSSTTGGCPIDVDPPGRPLDYALLAACGAACIPFLAANLLIFVNRKRAYFQVQGGAALILASSAAGLLWIGATFITNLHFHRYSAFLLLCPLWSFWLKFTFGFWLVLITLSVRLLHLLRLCKSGFSSAIWTLSITLILWSPGFLFSLAATIADASTKQGIGGLCANCTLKFGWKLSSFFTLPWIYFTILVVILIKSKGIKDPIMAMEYSHTSEYAIVAFVIFLLYGVAMFTKSSRKVYGRCFLTFCICCIVFADFWGRFGLPLYLCFFKGKSEMDHFEEELRHSGADCLDKLGSRVSLSELNMSCASPQTSGDRVLTAIETAMVEVSECKEKINHLEQRKSTLLSKIKQLEGLGRSSV